MKKVLQKPKVDGKPTGISYPYPEMNEENQSSKTMLWTVSISFVGHLVLIVALIFSPQLSFNRSYKPSVINVMMVSPGDLRSDPGSGAVKKQLDKIEAAAPVMEELPQKVEPEPEAKAKPETVEVKKKVAVEKKPATIPKVEEPKAEVSLAPKDARKEKPLEKIEPKTSLKKETFKPSEVVKGAIQQLEKETEETRADSVTEAIARLRRDVEKGSPQKRPAERSGGGSERGAGGGGTGSGYGGGGVLGSGEIMTVYQSVIAHHIQGNWAFSEQLARGQSNLETLVGIKIMPNGEIQDVWIDKKSGNPHMDESAIRAIKKSNPLPPLPRDTGRYYMIGLRFTPKGLDG